MALAAPVTWQPPLTCFMPVRRRTGRLGPPLGEPAPDQWLRRLPGLARTDGFVELPPGPNTYPKAT